MVLKVSERPPRGLQDCTNVFHHNTITGASHMVKASHRPGAGLCRPAPGPLPTDFIEKKGQRRGMYISQLFSFDIIFPSFSSLSCVLVSFTTTVQLQVWIKQLIGCSPITDPLCTSLGAPGQT